MDEARSQHDQVPHTRWYVSNIVYLILNTWGSGYYMTEVGDLASSCDGTIGPDGCSGLAIVSKFPFVEVRWKILF